MRHHLDLAAKNSLLLISHLVHGGEDNTFPGARSPLLLAGVGASILVKSTLAMKEPGVAGAWRDALGMPWRVSLLLHLEGAVRCHFTRDLWGFQEDLMGWWDDIWGIYHNPFFWDISRDLNGDWTDVFQIFHGDLIQSVATLYFFVWVYVHVTFLRRAFRKIMFVEGSLLNKGLLGYKLYI